MVSRQFIYLFISCIFFDAHAVLIERDWLTENDALLTYDTESGLEWLDVPVTSDMSYNDVSSEIINNSAYQGFSYASAQQITFFFNSGNLEDFYDATDAPEEILKIEKFLGYWGVCWYIGTGQRTEFITSETSGLAPGNYWSGRLVWFPPGTAAYTAKGETSVHENDSGFTFGSALVRKALPVNINGDLNKDGSSNVGDLKIMFNIILGNPVENNIEPGHADYYPPNNPDGIINMPDLILMLKNIF